MAQVLKIEDLIGTTYNRFTILEEGVRHVEPNGKAQRVMVCECSCGTIKNVQLKALRKGDIKSCGCLAKEIKVDISKNPVYNHWTILSEALPYVNKDGDKMRKVLAKCVCGIKKELVLSSLRTGLSKSCGCMVDYSWSEDRKGKRTTEESPIPNFNIEKANKREIGHWVIVEEISAKRNEKAEIIRTVMAQCKCGHTKITNLDNIGESIQCFKCSIEDRNNTISPEEKRARIKLAGVLSAMKSRCYNPNCKDYVSYGKKGLIVYENWRDSFKVFYDWAIANGYQIGLEIDRKDNTIGYTPENCRWVTKEENLLNMTTINLTLDDVAFIRSSKFNINTMYVNYTCSIDVLRRIMNYETFKNL